ncbi:MAG: hypothetical protein ACK5DD_17270 [Cyclobacteriaceae bacterium]|jgi:hypothetical protein
MVTRDDVKKELDKLPTSFLEEVYHLLKRLSEKKSLLETDSLSKIVTEFSDDFMQERKQGDQQIRELL